MHQRAGDGYTLLLAGGKLAWVVVKACAETDTLQYCFGMRAIDPSAKGHPEDHVFQNGETLEEVESLEHVANFRGSEPVSAGFLQRSHVDIIDSDFACIRGQDTCDQVEKCRLARSALTAKRHVFAVPERKFRNVDDF